MKGLEEKFLHTYNTYSDQIFRFVFFKLNDREKAKDFTQEVFMKTWLYISKNGVVENDKAFLYKIANNLVIDEYRKKGRVNVKSLDEFLEDGLDFGEDGSESMIDKIDAEGALTLIKSLPEVYSEVLFMRFVDELGVSEIASIMGKSVNVISVRINRGIKKLKEIVKDKKIQHEHI